MGELTTQDVEDYTKGRLPAGDAQTASLLKLALAGARRYCGWYVTPAKVADTLYLDGPGTRDLSLPVMNLTRVASCIEDLIDLGDVTDPLKGLAWSRQGLVRKRTGHRWSCQLGAIQIVCDYGYSEDDAADWRGAVLAACDLAVQNIGQTVQEYSVDDVVRKWFKSPQFAFNTALLDPYTLMGVA